MKKEKTERRYWIIPCNSSTFDVKMCLEENEFVDWKQSKYTYSIGDIVFILNKDKNGLSRIEYKMQVVEKGIPSSQYSNDRKYWSNIKEFQEGLSQNKFVRLKLLAKAPENSNALSKEKLTSFGLTGTVQGAQHNLSKELINYINQAFIISSDEYPDEVEENTFYEGASKTVTVNKYERDPKARELCLKTKGYSCSVCGMNFENIYGTIGKQFIHVHHIKPLAINKEYELNPVEDLVPVCPNCHAMLHRGQNGGAISVEELKQIIESTRQKQ